MAIAPSALLGYNYWDSSPERRMVVWTGRTRRGPRPRHRKWCDSNVIKNSHIRTFSVATLVVGTAALLLLERSGDAALPSTFVDVTTARGIDVNTVSQGNLDWGSGVAFTDYDNDGNMDLYVAMGHGEANRLYQSDNAVTFTDRAAVAGCADPGNGKGVKLADYDNDGDQDLFVANMGGSNRLYQNDGTGNYTDVTSAAGLVYRYVQIHSQER